MGIYVWRCCQFIWNIVYHERKKERKKEQKKERKKRQIKQCFEDRVKPLQDDVLSFGFLDFLSFSSDDERFVATNVLQPLK